MTPVERMQPMYQAETLDEGPADGRDSVSGRGHGKRLMLHVPSALLDHIERCCARRGTPVSEAVREILEREFPLPARAP